jgi:hypothetical protein
MDIGATMGERLIFHANIGFCIAAAFGLLKLFQWLGEKNGKVQTVTLYGMLLLVVFFAGLKTWERNFDWKNDISANTCSASCWRCSPANAWAAQPTDAVDEAG